jgi:hypothetical protein
MNIQELEQAVKTEVNERAQELKESGYSNDLLFELADSYVPLYNQELAEYLAHDPSLAYVDDEGLVDLSKGIFQFIQVSILERLIKTAHEASANIEYNEPEAEDLISVVYRICDPSGQNLRRTF